ncbi:hypothetical protein TrST_g9676 [Triparma strigata]|uniref:Uncharacterized protein n=1 Tax=Triparma strigata TaxID=1606541 RepID=A0A9W7A7Q1_9STRA|nr:hypothetical protein TrST_g9676 [Triparma strigata]
MSNCRSGIPSLVSTRTPAASLLRRSLSSAPGVASPPNLTIPMIHQITSATSLLLSHGVPSNNLKNIAQLPGAPAQSLVAKWQKMMETHLTAQVHILSGLGYPNSEQGISMYNQQLAQVMASSAPEDAEMLRVGSRDMWRLTLSSAFNLDLDPNNDGVILGRGEMNIVQARELMHAVSQSMSSSSFLDEIRQQVGNLSDMIEKHTAIQTLLLSSVYLSPSNNLCKQFDDNDELGYVKMQCLLAEHQSDPLIAQYVGKSMVEVLKAGGMDEGAIRQDAQKM